MPVAVSIDPFQKAIDKQNKHLVGQRFATLVENDCEKLKGRFQSKRMCRAEFPIRHRARNEFWELNCEGSRQTVGRHV